MQKIIFKLQIWLILCVFLGVLMPTNIRAFEKEKRVLFISSYSYAWSLVPLQMRGIQSVLGDEIVLDYKFMDTKRVDDMQSIQLFYDTLKYDLSKVEPYDVIIVGDDAALRFALDYKEELFPNTPVVFEGINDLQCAKEAGKRKDFTGVMEAFAYRDNIDLAKKLYPDAKKIIGIVDNTISGQAEERQFFAYRQEYPEMEFETLNTSEYSEEELCEQIAAFDQNTIVLYLLCSEDKYGNTYTTKQAAGMFAKYSKVPVFRMIHDGVGDGLFGGKVVSLEEAGRIAAEMTIKIIEGTSPEFIEVETESPYCYYFDYQVLKKYGIDKELLPKDTVFVNEEKNFWESHASTISKVLFVVLLIFFAAALIIWIVYLYQRARISKELDQKNQLLSETLDKVEHQVQEKSAFLARLSHEIRVPMNDILERTTLMRQDVINDENLINNLDRIGKSSKDLIGIVNDVLDMAAIENDKLILMNQEFDLQEFINTLKQDFEKVCQSKTVSFSVHCFSDEKIILYGDQMRLRQVIENLLSASISFTTSGDEIKVTISEEEKTDARCTLQFAVSDTGEGMDESIIERFFRPFEQEDSKPTIHHGGLGLRMMVTRDIVELMNGEVQVVSERGEGTTIRFIIPFEYK